MYTSASCLIPNGRSLLIPGLDDLVPLFFDEEDPAAFLDRHSHILRWGPETTTAGYTGTLILTTSALFVRPHGGCRRCQSLHQHYESLEFSCVPMSGNNPQQWQDRDQSNNPQQWQDREQSYPGSSYIFSVAVCN